MLGNTNEMKRERTEEELIIAVRNSSERTDSCLFDAVRLLILRYWNSLIISRQNAAWISLVNEPGKTLNYCSVIIHDFAEQLSDCCMYPIFSRLCVAVNAFYFKFVNFELVNQTMSKIYLVH